MRKIFLHAFCLVFVLTLCLPLAACDMEFGGLVGELMAGNNVEGEETLGQIYDDVIIEDILPDIEIETAIDTNWDEVFTGDIYTEMPTEDITYDDVIEFPTGEIQTTEPPIVDCIIPDPVLHFAFDECDAWIGDTQVQQFFTPGQHASWDGIAIIEDHNVEYVRIRGWVAFSAAQIGEIGYCIDYDTYEFNNAFFTDTEQPVIDAALSMGAQSASRIEILIPVRQLSGEHVLEIVAKDESGYLEIIGTFKLDKAVDPNAPVFNFWPADMMSSLVDQVGRHDIESGALSGNGEYVTITTGTMGDPWYYLSMVNGKGYVASYIAIKYRTTSTTTTSGIFVGSGVGPTGQGDMFEFELTNDGKWHIAIIDLSEVSAVENGVVNYLRWDMFTGGQNQVIDMGYIAAFTTKQAALDYDASLADRYTD